MNKFSLIHTGGPYHDEISTYEGRLNQLPLTVEEFIQDMFAQHPDEWGTIRVFEPAEMYLFEYSHGEITRKASYFQNFLGRRIKSFSARGGWTLMDYNLLLEDE